MRIGAITLTLAFSMGFAFLVLAGMPPASDAGPCPSTLEVANGNADDAIGDCVDNCTEITNVSQIDMDTDGYGNFCDGDFDQTGVNDFGDLATMLAQLGYVARGPPYTHVVDMNSDGTIGFDDLALFFAVLGFPPGPTALACAGTSPCP